MTRKEKFWQDLKSGKFISMVKESSKGQALTNSREVHNIMKPLFSQDADVEALYCIFLDTKNRIIAIEKVFSGSINSSPVYPREIVKKVLTHKAAALILGHNHPSGSCEPSSEDRSITIKLGIALASIDVTLHDHMIVGNGYHSMADDGWLAKVSEKFKHHLNHSQEVKK
jgi:DNA repair protein RadC